MVNLSRALSWPAVVGLGPTTVTEGGGGAPVSLHAMLELTELYQRALGEAVGCWGGGGAIVVMEKRRGQPMTGNGDGGLSARGRLLLRAL